jgi:hypothetical protein
MNAMDLIGKTAMEGPGLVAVDVKNQAGVITWWTLSGDVDLPRLARAWLAEGLDPELLPKPTSAKHALREAMKEISAGSIRRMVRPTGKRQGYAVVTETADGEDLEYDVGVRVKIEAGDGGLFEGEHPVFTPPDHPRVGEITAVWEKHRGRVSQHIVGQWLAGLTSRADGVALRESGGLYFIPRHELPLWEAITRAVKGATANRVFGIPAMPVADTIDAVVAAHEAEAEAEAAKIAAEVAKGNLGERGLETRLVRSNAIEEKIARCEANLGVRLESMRAKLEELRGTIVAATLSAMKSEEEEAAS